MNQLQKRSDFASSIVEARFFVFFFTDMQLTYGGRGSKS